MWPQNFIFFCFCGPHWLWYRHQCVRWCYDWWMRNRTSVFKVCTVHICRLSADLIHRALRCESVTESHGCLHSERMMTVQLLFLWVHWCWSSVQTNHLWDEVASWSSQICSSCVIMSRQHEPKHQRNVCSTLLNLLWRIIAALKVKKKKTKFSTRKVYLIMWPVSVYDCNEIKLVNLFVYFCGVQCVTEIFL